MTLLFELLVFISPKTKVITFYNWRYLLGAVPFAYLLFYDHVVGGYYIRNQKVKEDSIKFSFDQFFEVLWLNFFSPTTKEISVLCHFINSICGLIV